MSMNVNSPRVANNQTAPADQTAPAARTPQSEGGKIIYDAGSPPNEGARSANDGDRLEDQPPRRLPPRQPAAGPLDALQPPSGDGARLGPQ